MNTLIIVTGPTCTGKTTLAKKISGEFNLPLITKDQIKELLFDEIGYKDREWSKKIGEACVKIMYIYMEEFMKTGKPFIAENTFKKELDSEKFRSLLKKHKYTPLQFLCFCDGKTLYSRFVERSESGQRHPGHVDHKNYDRYKDILLTGRRDPLDIGGEVIEVDSTNFENVDYETILKKVRETIEKNVLS